MSNPQTPRKGRSSEESPLEFQTPSKQRVIELENVLDNSTDRSKEILNESLSHMKSIIHDRDLAESFAAENVKLMDMLLAHHGYDRGVLLQPDVEEALLARGRREATGDAEQDDEAGQGDADDDEFDPDADVVEEDTIIQEPGERTTVVVNDNRGMYSGPVLRAFHLVSGQDGSTAHKYILQGSEGSEKYTTVTVAFSAEVDAEEMNERKNAFVASCYRGTWNVGSPERPKFVKAHPYTVHAIANFLFDTMATAGFNSVKAIVAGYHKPTSDGVLAGASITAMKGARKEGVPEIKIVCEYLAQYLVDTAEKNAFWHFQLSIRKLQLYAKWEALNAAMEDTDSAVFRKIDSFATANRLKKSGRKGGDHVKSYLSHITQISAGDLQNISRNIAPLAAVVGENDHGFLALLNHQKFSKLSKYCSSLMPHFVLKFKELNPELQPLTQRLNDELINPMLRGDIDRMRLLNSVEVGRVGHVQGKIESLMTSNVMKSSRNTSTDENEDISMGDAE